MNAFGENFTLFQADKQVKFEKSSEPNLAWISYEICTNGVRRTYMR